MRVTDKGQVTIPKDLRDELGIGPGSEVSLQRSGDTLVVHKVGDGPVRGRRIAERLLGRGDVALSTEQIMALTRGE